jgi:hypothetical protein
LGTWDSEYGRLRWLFFVKRQALKTFFCSLGSNEMRYGVHGITAYFPDGVEVPVVPDWFPERRVKVEEDSVQRGTGVLE